MTIQHHPSAGSRRTGRRNRPERREATPAACPASRRRAVTATVCLVGFVACEGGNDRAEAPAPADAIAVAGQTDDTLRMGGPSDLSHSDRPPAQEIPLRELGFDFGSDDAPVGVIEFSDYGCGYCRLFHKETFPTLRRDYIETGRVRWKYVTYVSGMFANSMAAAFTAECAGEQGRFARANHLLYERQREWSRLEDPLPVFKEIVREAEADLARFQACIDEERPRARVRSGIVVGRGLGLRGTPTFLVEGVPVVGAQPLDRWIRFLNAIDPTTGNEAPADDPPGGERPR